VKNDHRDIILQYSAGLLKKEREELVLFTSQLFENSIEAGWGPRRRSQGAGMGGPVIFLDMIENENLN
jgi:hypothetical protein